MSYTYNVAKRILENNQVGLLPQFLCLLHLITSRLREVLHISQFLTETTLVPQDCLETFTVFISNIFLESDISNGCTCWKFQPTLFSENLLGMSEKTMDSGRLRDFSTQKYEFLISFCIPNLPTTTHTRILEILYFILIPKYLLTSAKFDITMSVQK